MGKNRAQQTGLELQEAARVILDELYQRKDQSDGGFSQREGVQGQGFYGGDAGDFRGLRRKNMGSGDEAQSFGKKDIYDERDGAPGFGGREFLSRRVQRRGASWDRFGENAEGDGQGKSGSVIRAERPGHIGSEELSERLSECYCRDARRYDGAFERF